MGHTADEVKEALAFQKLKKEIIGLAAKWDEYARARAIAKDKKWFYSTRENESDQDVAVEE